MLNSSSSEDNERFPLRADGRREAPCMRCCTLFMISFTFTAFVILLGTGLYYMLVLGDAFWFPWYLLMAIFCLCEFIYLLGRYCPSLQCRRQTSAPVRVPLAESLRTLILNRSQSDGVLIDIPGHAESTLSLPVQIMISTGEGGENVELKTSTESIQNVEGRDEESAGSTKKEADVQFPSEEVKETVVKVVDETAHGKSSAEVAAEGSTKLPAEAPGAAIQGVRQRKPSPMEPQKHVPLPEGEKTE